VIEAAPVVTWERIPYALAEYVRAGWSLPPLSADEAMAVG
jgi:hypothetical protein